MSGHRDGGNSQAALDIHCLRREGRAALTQRINLIPPPRGDGGARAITA